MNVVGVIWACSVKYGAARPQSGLSAGAVAVALEIGALPLRLCLRDGVASLRYQQFPANHFAFWVFGWGAPHAQN